MDMRTRDTHKITPLSAQDPEWPWHRSPTISAKPFKDLTSLPSPVHARVAAGFTRLKNPSSASCCVVYSSVHCPAIPILRAVAATFCQQRKRASQASDQSNKPLAFSPHLRCPVIRRCSNRLPFTSLPRTDGGLHLVT